MKIYARKLVLFIHLSFLYSTMLSASVIKDAHRDHLIEANTAIHENFMNNLKASERLHIEMAYDLLKSTKHENIRLPKLPAPSAISTISDPEEIILFVPGIPDHDIIAYSQSLYQLSLIRAPVYIHNWSKKRTLSYNTRYLQKGILRLSKEFPESKITIIGYCGGGLLSGYALKHFRKKNPQLYARLYAHTVATPFAGYGAPRFARVVSPFIGRSVIQVGLGVQFSDLNQQKLRCTQWATVNCDLDWHACRTDNTLPQLIARSGKAVENVCEGGLVKLDNRTHATATAHVIRETLDQTTVNVSQNANGLLP